MSHVDSLYACVYVADFPAQALLRLRPDIAAGPVAVLEGSAPEERVCSLNRHARLCGAVFGMTRLECEGIPGLLLVSRSRETEAAARSVLLECAARFSPRIQAPRIQEESEGTACAFVLDITGTERLFGPAQQLGQHLRSAISAVGLRASVAISSNYATARMKAAATRTVTVIEQGSEAAVLAGLPVSALNLPVDAQETFAIWGIRTLGELACLPQEELIARMGQQAQAWRRAALGVLPHMFQPIEPDFLLHEFCAFEDPVEQIDSILFVGARMIQSLVHRADARALALSSIAVRMKLENGHTHECVLKPALSSSDQRFLLKLLQLELAAHPPQAAVLVLELQAEAGHASTLQLGLFVPQTPDSSRLDITLARIKAIVGEDRVGAPVLEDTHRPGAFHMECLNSSGSDTVPPDRQRMALRRMRPPVPVRVSLNDQHPCWFRDSVGAFDVTAAYGPWKSNGCWWSKEAWNLEEWDVMASRQDGPDIACLLVHNAALDTWQLEAIYD